MYKHIKKILTQNREEKEIRKRSGWDKRTTAEKLSIAKAAGMKRKRFLYNEGWKYSIEEIEKLNEEIEKIMKERKYELASLSSRHKILKEEIVGRKLRANAVGISDKDFFGQQLYLLNKKEFEKLLEERSLSAEK